MIIFEAMVFLFKGFKITVLCLLSMFICNVSVAAVHNDSARTKSMGSWKLALELTQDFTEGQILHYFDSLGSQLMLSYNMHMFDFNDTVFFNFWWQRDSIHYKGLNMIYASSGESIKKEMILYKMGATEISLIFFNEQKEYYLEELYNLIVIKRLFDD